MAEAPKKRVNPIKRKQMEDRVRELEEEIGRRRRDRATGIGAAELRQRGREPAAVAGTGVQEASHAA